MESNQFAAARWLFKRLGRGALNEHVFAAAAECGSLEMMRWLHELGCAWNSYVFCYAAGNGGEERLEWLAENGCPMSRVRW